MLYVIRHLVAVALLPVTMAVVIPWWLARRNGIELVVGPGPLRETLQLAGVAVLCVGLLVFASSLRRFAGEGRGTLAPWDPPRELVVRGPYRYVRNPMISGVVLVLFAEALILQSRPHLEWALLFLGINAIYIPLIEEPQLAMRFGDAYREYCRHVPRLLPRWRPWEAG
ncbi:MAG TPA: isoprenylcysteine carboxylmethyltransferase family protein [Gemmatimonadales bacterium]|jgi:protein-S-isoprenylcysteine O-methyltransferase Ste14